MLMQRIRNQIEVGICEVVEINSVHFSSEIDLAWIWMLNRHHSAIALRTRVALQRKACIWLLVLDEDRLSDG